MTHFCKIYDVKIFKKLCHSDGGIVAATFLFNLQNNYNFYDSSNILKILNPNPKMRNLSRTVNRRVKLTKLGARGHHQHVYEVSKT